ncbi:MAG: BolA/IbaG family iron-sulfur metabolism protein [Rhodoferax sp.]|jgi:acid stress-induced BolA-like protein IbaG/YrbA|nr:BolA/IbaG family iron-sulfur metabolism protein [Rhodoferax sp.]
MTALEIQNLIENFIACEVCHIDGDGRHWYATVVSASFEGVRTIARHQKVYAAMGTRMKTDEVHALSIKAHTPAEWAVLTA